MQPKQIDWGEILLDLRRQGIGLLEVAQRIRIAKSTVYDWSRGAEPRHYDGEALIQLWMEVTGRDRSDLPPRTLNACTTRLSVTRLQLVGIPERGFLQNH